MSEALNKPHESNENFGYKTPEELARALEERWNTILAKRVEEIALQVWENTTNWLDSLKLEFNEEEERSLRETLPSTANTFDQWMTEQDKAIQAWLDEAAKHVPWGRDTVEQVQRTLSLWERFSKAWETAGKLFSEWSPLKAVWAFFSILFGKASVEEVSWGGNIREGNWKLTSEQVFDKLPSNMDYIWTLKVLLWFSPDKKWLENSYWILNFPQIKSKTFSELKALKKEWIINELRLPDNNPWYEKEIYDAIQLLIIREDFINEVIWKQKPNWRKELTLEQLLTESYQYTRVYSSFENITLNDFVNPSGTWISFWSFSLTNPSDSDLTSRFQTLRNDRTLKLRWASPELLAQLLADSNSKITSPNILNTLELSNNSEWDKEFSREIVSFWQDMLVTISNDFFLWEEEFRWDFEKYFKERSLSTKETLELYLITWWKTEYSQMSWFEKWLIYFKVWSFLWLNYKLRWQTYDRAMLSTVNWESKELLEKIPQPVIEIIKSMALYTIDNVVSATWGMAKEIFSMLTWQQKISLWVWSWIVLVALWRLWPLRNQFAWAMTWLTAAWVIAVVSAAYSNNPEEFKRKFGDKTPEELWDELYNDINSNI